VVCLREDGEAVVLEPLDDPKLPERLPAVQGLGHDLPHEPFQQTLVPRAGETQVPQVVVQVEAGVVNPYGMIRERRPRQALAVARHAVERRFHELADPLDFETVACPRERRRIEDGHRPHVHVGISIFDLEEGRIEGGETFEVGVGHGRIPFSLLLIFATLPGASTPRVQAAAPARVRVRSSEALLRCGEAAVRWLPPMRSGAEE
jgi:hypothetical protein